MRCDITKTTKQVCASFREANSLDPDQAQPLVRKKVGPDLGPNCLHSLLADDTGRCHKLEGLRIYCTYVPTHYPLPTECGP